jgi:DNA-binding MarR family transcriptional regulator
MAVKKTKGSLSAHAEQRITRAWREMRRGAAMGPYQDLLYREVVAEGLPLGLIDALDLLVKRNRIRMVDFARALRIEKSTATRALDRLESGGFAQRKSVSAKGQGQAVVVQVTPRARALQERLSRRRAYLLGQILAEFSAHEVEVLADVMERFVAGMDRGGAEAYQEREAERLRELAAPTKPRR